MNEFNKYLENNNLNISDLTGEEYGELYRLYNTYVRFDDVALSMLKQTSGSVINNDLYVSKYKELADKTKGLLDYSITLIKSRKNKRK